MKLSKLEKKILPWLLMETNVGIAFGAKNWNICSSREQECVIFNLFNVSTSIIMVIDLNIFIEWMVPSEWIWIMKKKNGVSESLQIVRIFCVAINVSKTPFLLINWLIVSYRTASILLAVPHISIIYTNDRLYTTIEFRAKCMRREMKDF